MTMRLEELLAQLWVNTHSNEHSSFRLSESDTLNSDQTVLVQNGLFVLCAILSEKAKATLSESSFSAFGGRILLFPSAAYTDSAGFSNLLRVLDGADAIVCTIGASVSYGFKAHSLYDELRCYLSTELPYFWRVVASLVKACCLNLDRDNFLFLHQVCKLLSKLHLSRDSLLRASIDEYVYFEETLSAEVACQSRKPRFYRSLVDEMRVFVDPLSAHFRVDPRLAKHGPGAVSVPGVRSIVEKFSILGFDARIDYLLRKELAGSMEEYSPWILGEGDRTSRSIFVPKSWKSLRGISAEPAGLQYFQQAVLSGMVKAMKQTTFGRIINLSSQEMSRFLAIDGSRDGSSSTIDLSAASDSVTLQLVKDLFGHSNLCRWLLATRSTHTVIGDSTLRLNKFAPMGSACCFPVECVIFGALVLAVLARRRMLNSRNLDSTQVFGDDIICPSDATDEVLEGLNALGFSVNTGKSYMSGNFRESCGVDAWHGWDVTPLKLKDFSYNFDGSHPCSYEHRSRIISYLNTLYHHGYVKTRSFLLRKFLASPIRASRQRLEIRDTLIYGDGERGTVATVQPDNFHLQPAPVKGYQRSGYRYVTFSPRVRVLSDEEESLQSEVDYFAWLMKFSSDSEEPVQYDLAWFRSRNDTPPAHTREQMVPKRGVFDPEQPRGCS